LSQARFEAHEPEGDPVSDQIYKLVELTGTSSSSVEDAIQNAITRAGRTLRELRWFQVMETRGAIKEDKVTQWQVIIKVGFKLED
jgi:dodecin